jgi:hypothetical protein
MFLDSSDGFIWRLETASTGTKPTFAGWNQHVRRLETASTGAKPACAGLEKSAQADLDSIGAISNRQRIRRLETRLRGFKNF